MYTDVSVPSIFIKSMLICACCTIKSQSKLSITVFFFYFTDRLLTPNVRKDPLQTLPVIVHIPPPHNLTPLGQVTHHTLHHRIILIEVDLQVVRLIPDLYLHIILAHILDLPSRLLAILHHQKSS